MALLPNGNYLRGDNVYRAFAFASEVWAAETLLEVQWGAGNATPTRIRDMLTKMGRTHGYTHESLRKMIYIARQRVRQLETQVEPLGQVERIWPPFDRTQTSSDRS